MKRIVLWASVVCMGFVGVVRAESVSLVQITDMRGQVGYQVMNREELSALTKEIKEETAVFPAIAAECKKEWDANKDNKLPFQGAKIKPRTAKKGLDFMDREKADKKRSQLEDRSAARQSEEIAKEEKKSKQMKDEDISKEAAKTKAIDDAYEMISKKMGDKLGRPVPSFGFGGFDSGKDGVKKEEPKKEEKKEQKEKKEPKKAGK